jgi:hypothetical protein
MMYLGGDPEQNDAGRTAVREIYKEMELETIDGVASIVLESPHAGVTLLCNGSAWFVL